MHDVEAMPGRIEAWLAINVRPARGRALRAAHRRLQPRDGQGVGRPGRTATSEVLVLRGDPPPEQATLESDRDAEWALLQSLTGRRARPSRRPAGTSRTRRGSAPRRCSSTTSRRPRCRPSSRRAGPVPRAAERLCDLMADVASVTPEPTSAIALPDVLGRVHRRQAGAPGGRSPTSTSRRCRSSATSWPGWTPTGRRRRRSGSCTATSRPPTCSSPPTAPGTSSTGSSPASATPARTSATTTPTPARCRPTCWTTTSTAFLARFRDAHRSRRGHRQPGHLRLVHDPVDAVRGEGSVRRRRRHGPGRPQRHAGRLQRDPRHPRSPQLRRRHRAARSRMAAVITRPTTQQLLDDCAREVRETIMPIVARPRRAGAAGDARAAARPLRGAVRPRDRLDGRRVRRPCGRSPRRWPRPIRTPTRAGRCRSPADGRRRPRRSTSTTGCAVYDRAGQAFCEAIDVALRSDRADLAAQATALVRARKDREADTRPGFFFPGRA